MWACLMMIRRRRIIFLSNKTKNFFLYTAVFLILFLIRGLLFQPFGHGAGINTANIADMLTTLAPLVIFHVSVASGRQRELRILVIWILFCLLCATVMTYRGEMETEYASRLLTGKTGRGEYNFSDAELIMAGVVQRSQMYSIGLLIAPLLYCFRFMTLPLKILSLLCVVLFLYVSYVTSYSSLMIGIFIGCNLWLLTIVGIRERALKIIGILFVLVTIIITVYPQSIRFMASPLMRLHDVTMNEMYQRKIMAVVDTISGAGETLASSRADLYWKSWDAFCIHPLFGIGVWPWDADLTSSETRRGAELGGHSAVLDILGSSGLFGFSLFVLFFVFFFRYLRTITPTVIDQCWWPAIYLFFFPFIIFLFLNNLSGFVVYTDLFLLVPVMSLMFRNQKRIIVAGNVHPAR
jgi:hypothetical protein